MESNGYVPPTGKQPEHTPMAQPTESIKASEMMIEAKQHYTYANEEEQLKFRRVKGLQMDNFSGKIFYRYPLSLVTLATTTHQILLCLFTPYALSSIYQQEESFVCLKKPARSPPTQPW